MPRFQNIISLGGNAELVSLRQVVLQSVGLVDESTLYADPVVYGIEGAEALIDNVRTELQRG